MTVCVIPARGGSVRIPRKNIRMFAGVPIIAHSIRAAKRSGLFSNVIVSTDDNEISEIAQGFGADVMIRGERWAREDVGPLDVARHTLTLMAPCEFACVLYATAPLMAVSDLILGWRAVQRPGVMYALSAAATPFLHDAAQFVWCRSVALQERIPEFGDATVMIPIPRERDCDINVEADWIRAEAMYAGWHGGNTQIEADSHVGEIGLWRSVEQST